MEYTWKVIIASIVIALIFVFINTYSFRTSKKHEEESRAHALTKGLNVSNAVMPYWADYWAQKAPEDSNECTEYSFKHPFLKATQWAFLQRDEKRGNEFPYGWTLLVEEGQTPDRLKTVLMKIAQEWTEEYLA